MKIKKQLRIPAISIPLWWPDLPGDWRAWLPSRGNVIFTLVMIAVLLWAQSAGAVPFRAESAASTGTIAYQGRLANANGVPITETLNMSFRLYSAVTGGTPLWTEQWSGSNGVKVSDGLFNVMLGSLTPIAQSVITGNSNLFLGITIGTDDEMTPRVQLGSVPFAVQALSVPDGSITAAKLASDVSLVPPDGSITTAKLADGAVTSKKLAQGTLPTAVSKKHGGYTQAYALNHSSSDFTETATVVTVTTRSAIVINATASLALESGSGELYAQINRNTTYVSSQRYSLNVVSWTTWAWSGVDIVEPGTYTYVISGASYVGSIVIRWYNPDVTLTVIPLPGG